MEYDFSETEHWKPLEAFHDPKYAVTAADTYSASAYDYPNEDHHINLMDRSLPVPNEAIKLLGHTAPQTFLLFSPNGKWFASASEDATIRIWDVSDGACLAVLSGHDQHVTSLAFSDDSSLLASTSLDESVFVWNMRDFSKATALNGHKAATTACVFVQRLSLLVSASADGMLSFWEIGTSKQVGTLDCSRVVDSLAVSNDSQVHCTRGVDSLAVSNDSRVLVAGRGDGKIAFVDLDDRKVLSTVKVATFPCNAVCFSPDDLVVIVKADTTHIVSAATHTYLRSFQYGSHLDYWPINDELFGLRGCSEGIICRVSDGSVLKEEKSGVWFHRMRTAVPGGRHPPFSSFQPSVAATTSLPLAFPSSTFGTSLPMLPANFTGFSGSTLGTTSIPQFTTFQNTAEVEALRKELKEARAEIESLRKQLAEKDAQHASAMKSKESQE
jgi:hypothetical protein